MIVDGVKLHETTSGCFWVSNFCIFSLVVLDQLLETSTNKIIIDTSNVVHKTICLLTLGVLSGFDCGVATLYIMPGKKVKVYTDLEQSCPNIQFSFSLSLVRKKIF